MFAADLVREIKVLYFKIFNMPNFGMFNSLYLQSFCFSSLYLKHFIHLNYFVSLKFFDAAKMFFLITKIYSILNTILLNF